MAKNHFTFTVMLPGTTAFEEVVTVDGPDMRKAQVILENRYPQAALISFKRVDQEAYQRPYVDQVAPATPAAAPQRAAARTNGGGGVIAGGALLLILALGAIVPGGETTAPVVEEERIEEVRPIVAVPQGFEPIAPAGEPQPEPFFTDGIQEEVIDDLGQDWDN